MQIERIENDLRRAQQNNFREALTQQYKYVETKYRWVMLGLAGMILFLNGLMNNIAIPIQSTLALTYNVSSKLVNIGTIVSFLIFSIANIPSNYLLDKRGLRFGLLLGNSIYFVGIVICCFINVGFPFLIAGYLVFSFGQPFIVNIPAKLATYWFLPQNRTFATSILVGCNIFGSGLGFAIPALVVKQDQEPEVIKRQIFSLYLGYAIATLALLILNTVFLRAVPKTPSSNIQNKEQLSLKQTFQSIKKDRNLWKFFLSYSIFYGSFQIFGSISNFLIKPFGYKDLTISLSAVSLILLGAVGSVVSSIFIKRTRNYKLLITATTFAGTGIMILLVCQLFIIPNAFITIAIVGCLGFVVIPVIPNSYEIGCELAFPIGEAQVTGLLNGGSLIWAFVIDSLLTLIIGFGDKTKTFIYFVILIGCLCGSSFLYRYTEFHLKRKQFQQKQNEINSAQFTSKVEEMHSPTKMIEMTTPSQEEKEQVIIQTEKKERYNELNQQY